MKRFFHMGRILPCPHCGAPNNGVTSTDENNSTPTPGDATLCFSCGALGMYEEGMTVRKATSEEEEAMGGLDTVVRARKAIRYTESPELATSLMSIM